MNRQIFIFPNLCSLLSNLFVKYNCLVQVYLGCVFFSLEGHELEEKYKFSQIKVLLLAFEYLPLWQQACFKRQTSLF